MLTPQEIDWLHLGFNYYQGCTGYAKSVWQEGQGWSKPRWVSRTTYRMNIANGATHYGLALFDGNKATKHADGTIWAFRPWENAKRFKTGAEALAMPGFPKNYYLRCMELVVKHSLHLIPPHQMCKEGAAFYFRPNQFAMGNQMGVKPPKEVWVIMFGVPVGAYFLQGFSTMKVWLTRKNRVAPDSIGWIKAAANYVGTIPHFLQAQKLGCGTPLYTDPLTHAEVTETMASGYLAVIDGVLVTPPNSSLILPSITMDSILRYAVEDLGLKAQRAPIEVKSIAQIEEAGAAGTGAILAPIDVHLNDQGEPMPSKIAIGKPGPIMTQIYNHHLGILAGLVEDQREWLMPIA